MSQVSTTKPINLYQLGLEMGGPLSFTMIDYVTSRIVKTEDADQATLESAVDAHVADFGMRPPEPPVYATPDESLTRVARDIIVPRVLADELKDADAEAFAGLFPDWEPGIAVAAGEVYRWDGTLVGVIQGHTTAAEWEPGPATKALWKIHRTATAAPWVQPIATEDAYSIGEEVTHNAPAFPEFTLWRSKINANTTEPGTDGDFHRWWEPIS